MYAYFLLQDTEKKKSCKKLFFTRHTQNCDMQDNLPVTFIKTKQYSKHCSNHHSLNNNKRDLHELTVIKSAAKPMRS